MINLMIAMNVFQQSFISCFAIMTIVGFCLIYVDKKRWKEHCARSAEMMAKKKPQVVELDSALSEEAAVVDDNDKKKKSKKIKKDKTPISGDFEYNGRIKDRVLITLAVFFCGFGELLGMIIFRHKWYKYQYKIAIPLLALLNIGTVIVLVIACRGISGEITSKFFG